MPGITGIFSPLPAAEGRAMVDTMLASMRHEEFYRAGVFAAPELGLHAAWTAHPGSFAAGQVFANADRSVCLVLAGECFFEDGAGDGQRIVAAYEAQGPRFVAGLNGLFSGLLVDRRRETAYLFNDRYAAERLYVHEENGTLYFASEAKAILSVVAATRSLDPEGVGQLLSFGCTLGEKTLFRGVRTVPGGSLWTLAGGAVKKELYFSPRQWETQARLAPAEFARELRELLARIVPAYAQAPTPIGFSLTAGLDTRMLMAALPVRPERMVCFTYSGEDVDPIDVHIAARIALSCGLPHHALRIGPDFFSDFARWADRTVYITDGAFGVTGAHEIYMSRRARALAPTRLTGNYGGEILRGVSTFKPSPLPGWLLAPELRETQRRAILACGIDEVIHPVTFAAFKEMPLNLYGNLAAGRSQIGFRTPYLDNRFVELAYRCPASREDARAVCIEAIRSSSPTLSAIPTDKGFLGDSNPLASRIRQAWAKVAFKLDYMNNEGFPNALAPLEPLFQSGMRRAGLLGLHKHLHYRSWFRTSLAGYVTERLTDPRARRSGFWNGAVLDRLAHDHVRGRRNSVIEINAVLTLLSIEDLLINQKPIDDRRRPAAIEPAFQPSS